jgi:putative transposase
MACFDMGIQFNTFCQWREDPIDKRHGPLTTPANKLSDEERGEVIKIASSKEYVDDSPWIIVAKLADKGKYIASESTFYKILKEEKLLRHRGKSKLSNRYKRRP